MIKKFLLIIVLTFFTSTQAFSNSCPVLYPELLEMVENSKLPQEKIDKAKALIDKGWALHKELEDAPDDDRHYDALEFLFQALDILEAT
tara:strand:+ start:1248 stop:1514 length:267 start_codon:yes stop_codon:yes gene_type:complete